MLESRGKIREFVIVIIENSIKYNQLQVKNFAENLDAPAWGFNALITPSVEMSNMNDCRFPHLVLPLLVVVAISAALLPRPLLALPADNEEVESTVAPPNPNGEKSSEKTVQADMQKLMNAGLNALTPELVAKGTFYPFAAILGNDDIVRLVGVPAADQSQANPETALNALVMQIRKLAEERRIRAVAYFMDYVAQRNDTGFRQTGVRVELNHRHPDAMSVFIPYSITSDKKLRLMTPDYRPGKNLTF